MFLNSWECRTSVSPAFRRAPENLADIQVQNCAELVLFH